MSTLELCDRQDCYADDIHDHYNEGTFDRHRRYFPNLGYREVYTEDEWGVFADRGHGLMLQHTARSRAMAEMYAEGYDGPTEVRVRRVTRTPWATS